MSESDVVVPFGSAYSMYYEPSRQKQDENANKLSDKIYPLLNGYTLKEVEIAFDRVLDIIKEYQCVGKVVPTE